MKNHMTSAFFDDLSPADKRAFSAHPIEFFILCCGLYKDLQKENSKK